MILMFGDIHGNVSHILPAVIEEKASAIILLGDIEAQKPLHEELKEVMRHTEVYWIHGNHDNDSKSNYTNLFESELADCNLHGKIAVIDGVRVGGLGGVFRGRVWLPDPIDAEPLHVNYEALEKDLDDQVSYRKINKQKRDHELFLHKTTIFYEDWLNLYGQQADILVTHEAPSCHPYGYQAIDALAQSMRVKYLFHGHQHDRLNYSAHEERLGFSAHGVGFRGITDMYGGMIKIGAQDDARMKRQERVKID